MSNEHKKVYPHTLEYAAGHGEKELFRANELLNKRCAEAIDTAINLCCYETYFYNLEAAAKFVMDVYGAERVNMLLANAVRTNEYDARFSRPNKEWAQTIPAPDRTDAFSRAHPYLLNSFIDKAREAQKTSVLDRLEIKAKTVRQAESREPEKAKTPRGKRKEAIGE